MGFQTFICTICGESVTRRNSFQYGQGRACRKHEEVITDQKKKVDDLLNKYLKGVLTIYRSTVGNKQPSKELMRDWLEKYIRALQKACFKTDEDNAKDKTNLLASKELSHYKKTGMITTQYFVTDLFVDRMIEMVTNDSEENWKKEEEKKEAPKSHKPRTKKPEHAKMQRVEKSKSAK